MVQGLVQVWARWAWAFVRPRRGGVCRVGVCLRGTRVYTVYFILWRRVGDCLRGTRVCAMRALRCGAAKGGACGVRREACGVRREA